MRYLVFEKGADDDRYNVIYDGIIASNRGVVDAETRVLNRILDKFEVIGVPAGVPSRPKFELAKSGSVTLEDLEFALLDEILSNVRWATMHSRLAEAVVNWFRAAPNDGSALLAVGIVKDND